MHVICSIRVVSPHAEGPVPDRLRRTLVRHGWNPGEGDSYSISFPAGPGQADAPAIALHAMLVKTLGVNDGRDMSAIPVMVTCRYRDVDVFTDRVLAAEAGTDEAALWWDNGSPPFFSDLLRLRDKIIASVQVAQRREAISG